MDPSQNQYPVDYLNQIAPQQKTPTVNNKLVFGLIGGIILVAIIAVFALSSGGSGPTERMQTLAARLLTLQKVSSESQKSIKSGVLRSTNSNLSLYLANTNRDIAEPFSKNNVDVKKIDKEITDKESGEKLRKTLEDARLNAVFDQTYAREMTFQLETITALMTQISSSSKSKSLNDFLAATEQNLKPLKEQLSTFNAATG
jgi:predicted outer membrane protein